MLIDGIALAMGVIDAIFVVVVDVVILATGSGVADTLEVAETIVRSSKAEEIALTLVEATGLLADDKLSPSKSGISVFAEEAVIAGGV